MVKVEQVSIDGTKIKANAANRRMKNRMDYEQWLKRIDQEIDQMVQDAAVIEEAEVISEPNDREALISTLEQTEANIREEIAEVVADAGYSSYDNYEYLKSEVK